MSKFRYEDMTTEEREFLCNGCGPKGFIIPIPEFIFTASCDHHDFNYWRGFEEADRKWSDEKFYSMMLWDSYAYKGFKGYRYRFWAWTYFKFVRMCGWKFFPYGTRYLTHEDLLLKMKEA